MRISEIMNSYGISDVRDIAPTIVSGPTLETRPKILAELKKQGISTVVDFRGGDQPLLRNVCEEIDITYRNFDFNHAISSGGKTISQPANFIDELKKFFGIMNKGNAYIGCEYGIHRTNAALVYNHILNNPDGTRFATPQLFRINGDGDINSIINFLSRKVWKTIKLMTAEEKNFFNLKGTKREVFEHFILKKVGELKQNASKILL